MLKTRKLTRVRLGDAKVLTKLGTGNFTEQVILPSKSPGM